MKQKEYEHCYKTKHRRISTARMWLMLFKAWTYEFQLKFGIIKRRHRRSITYVRMMALIGDNNNYRFTRRAITIGRCKHGKFHYMPKRVRLEQIE